jgi:hypothetical protein
MPPQEGLELGNVVVPAGLAKAAGRGRGEKLPGQDIGKEVVHASDRVAHGHGGEGIAMVAGAQGQQAVTAGLAPGLVVLEGHLDGHLHRHRARIAEKDVLEGLRRQVHQTFHQAHRRLVGKAAEHDMGHAVELVADGLIENRVIVAVDGAPPGRHAIDENPAIHEFNVAAVGGAHRMDGIPFDGRGVGMPGMGLVDGQQFFGAAHLPSPRQQRLRA